MKSVNWKWMVLVVVACSIGAVAGIVAYDKLTGGAAE